MFAMSRGGMPPEMFSRLHPRYESPVAVIILVTLVTALSLFFGRRALVWFVDAGGLAAVLAYFFVTVSFLTIRGKYPTLDRPYRVPAARLVGTLAVLSTVLFVLLYLPGSPSALLWPEEWIIVLAWAVLGLVFFTGARKRAAAMGAKAQREAILGPYAKKI